MSSQNLNLLPSIERLVKDYVKGVYGVELDTLVSCFKEQVHGRPIQEIKEEFEQLDAKKEARFKELDKKREEREKDPENILTNGFLTSLIAKSQQKKVSSKDKAKCIHPIAKGEKKGQPCGTSVSEESKSGKYCKKHLAQEGKDEPVEKKTVSKKTATEQQPLNKFTKDELKEKIEKRTTEIEVRRNKFGNWEHQGSGILIDRDTRKAYGKQQSNGSVVPLTSEDIELCKTIGFKYILPDNISSNDNEDMEEEDDEDEDLDIDDDIDDEDME